jgi:hypothetical protein
MVAGDISQVTVGFIIPALQHPVQRRRKNKKIMVVQGSLDGKAIELAPMSFAEVNPWTTTSSC